MSKLLPSGAGFLVSIGLGGRSSPQSACRPGTSNVRPGLFRTNISIGGVGGGDGTQVSVRID